MEEARNLGLDGPVKYLILALVILTGQLAWGDMLTTSLTSADLFPGYLDGDFQIRQASARPAARVYYLIHAAALDQYALDHRGVLDGNPPLALLLKDAKTTALLRFERYTEMMGKDFKPMVNADHELADLERFMGSGYSGELKPQLLAYLEELKKVGAVNPFVPAAK